jgi:hypothetical protein
MDARRWKSECHAIGLILLVVLRALAQYLRTAQTVSATSRDSPRNIELSANPAGEEGFYLRSFVILLVNADGWTARP